MPLSYTLIIESSQGLLVGQAGFIGSAVLLTICFVIALITVISLNVIVSFNNVKSERGSINLYTYNSIKQVTGKNCGAMAGILFFISYCTAISYYCLAFAEATISELVHVKISMENHTEESKFVIFSTIQVTPWNKPGSWMIIILGTVILLSLTSVGFFKRSVSSVIIPVVVIIVIMTTYVLSIIFLAWPPTDETVKNSTGNTGWMHERFAKNLQRSELEKPTHPSNEPVPSATDQPTN